MFAERLPLNRNRWWFVQTKKIKRRQQTSLSRTKLPALHIIFVQLDCCLVGMPCRSQIDHHIWTYLNLCCACPLLWWLTRPPFIAAYPSLLPVRDSQRYVFFFAISFFFLLLFVQSTFISNLFFGWKTWMICKLSDACPPTHKYRMTPNSVSMRMGLGNGMGWTGHDAWTSSIHLVKMGFSSDTSARFPWFAPTKWYTH